MKISDKTIFIIPTTFFKNVPSLANPPKNYPKVMLAKDDAFWTFGKKVKGMIKIDQTVRRK